MLTVEQIGAARIWTAKIWVLNQSTSLAASEFGQATHVGFLLVSRICSCDCDQLVIHEQSASVDERLAMLCWAALHLALELDLDIVDRTLRWDGQLDSGVFDIFELRWISQRWADWTEDGQRNLVAGVVAHGG